MGRNNKKRGNFTALKELPKMNKIVKLFGMILKRCKDPATKECKKVPGSVYARVSVLHLVFRQVTPSSEATWFFNLYAALSLRRKKNYTLIYR